ncbi:catalase family protein [Lichenihabitans sp. Uapishka_5]|uniref:catalase family protein n=1 Tax=Lichenihabitans sp. Uapishka_5 TaxID=3037302 RepID=UPI0029E817EC|nr:catalase family protein [Lichenihabitans sp. Uapishka_5]MDX7953651.1 catalase family protein [Lichenihabitans sp. Uapishka_5]
MPQHLPPLRFHPSFETIPPDEAEVEQGLTEAMLAIQRKTHADEGHAYRAVHAKAHGYVRARFTVLPGLPPEYAQGVFATPAAYEAMLRFSTTPGDILGDNVSTPRGMALKVFGVPGERLPDSTDEATQNWVLGNSPAFQIGTAKGFLRQLRPLAATTGLAEPVKHVLSVVTGATEAALETVGIKSATLTTLAGQARTELLGDSFFSQAALLHGDYFGKVAVSPLSPSLTALSEKPLDVTKSPDAIREAVSAYFRSLPAVWEMRVQLGTRLEATPIEDAAAQWPEDESPYVAVARIEASPQDTWSDALRDLVEDRLAFNPWTGLAAHRPLGSIMRARRPAYAAARAYRADANGVTITEPAQRPAA